MQISTDQSARFKALDTKFSCIVRAPAGSGKTQLLTLRFLALLGQVKKDPEEILAITFTRKAVAEMRDRILNALIDAKNGKEKIDPLGQQINLFSQRVLARDAKEGWNLLENPNRLRIQTIDSFCAYLSRQMPFSGNFITASKVSDDVSFLYQQAVRETLQEINYQETWSAPIEQLLLHLDNAFDKVEALLMDMLARRDQWLPYLTQLHDVSRADLERGLIQIIADHLTALVKKFPKTYLLKLIPLLCYAAQQLAADHELKIFLNESYCPSASVEDYPAWLAIAQLLLTKEKQWKKTFTQRDGFSAHKDPVSKSMKENALEILHALSKDEGLRVLLADLIDLPAMSYSDQQWNLITAWLKILPVLLAHLKLVFQREGVVDYVEISLNAQSALGEMDAPSDLALSLDRQIQHILVDEFQDTSFSQWRLLEKLTAGWQSGDGRTLFLVGDPMQSIYRFRKAEVGIFLRAWERGIHSLTLLPLVLQRNFRSQAKLVEWVNQLFTQVMPCDESVASGAIQFSPSISTKAEQETCSIEWYPLFDERVAIEDHQIVSIIQKIFHDEPNANIAILVKSRTHIQSLLPLLRTAKISYRAMDVEALGNRAVVTDLFALTRAFLNPLDRIAWLACLRAPWCGLELVDLYQIAGIDHATVIWERIVDFSALDLSEEAKIRLAHFVTVMEKNFEERGRLSLRATVEKIWYELNGAACLKDFNEQQNVDAFFKVLDEISIAGDILDFSQLENRLNKLYADASLISDSPMVEIMTIHKAKGLEFDHVILPALHRRTANDDAKLLLWSEYMSIDEQNHLILGPIKPVSGEKDPMYEYLKRQEFEKARHEMLRLFYVAVTRAKKSLHLIGVVTDARKPAAQSFLGQIWSYAWPIFERAEKSGDRVVLEEPNERPKRFLRRLKREFFVSG